MLLFVRRLLVMIALFFWQGGFTFYAAVVVPVAQEQLGHLRQGFITRQVTVYLNLAGALALLCLAWDVLIVGYRARWRLWARYLLWVGMVSALVLLHGLHGTLNEQLIVKGRIIRDQELFHAQHRLYLWISTVQWAYGLLYLLLTLVIWRAEDRLSPAKYEVGGEKLADIKRSTGGKVNRSP